MLAQQRQAIILDLVHRDGGVRLRDLMHRLGVSDMTVRRDLADLAERGLVEKVHGGATRPAGTTAAAPQADAVAAIARHALAFVEPGAAIALSNGPLTTALAHCLADRPRRRSSPTPCGSPPSCTPPGPPGTPSSSSAVSVSRPAPWSGRSRRTPRPGSTSTRCSSTRTA